MKRIVVILLVLICIFSIVGCSSTPAQETSTSEPPETTEMIPEPTEKPIEVTENIVVTFDDFIKKCDEEKVYIGLDYNKVLRLIENEDGFSFRRDGDDREEKTIFGNTDKDKNLTSVTIVCKGVQVDWIRDKEAIEDFYERYMKADFMSMPATQLLAYNRTHDAIDMVEMVYALISNKTGTWDVAAEILTCDNPVQFGKWSVSTVADKDNYTVTIEAKYNNK